MCINQKKIKKIVLKKRTRSYVIFKVIQKKKINLEKLYYGFEMAAHSKKKCKIGRKNEYGEKSFLYCGNKYDTP